MKWSCITVMPVYNEAACVERVCREWLAHMDKAGGALLVVNDGSHDETPRILDRLTATEARLLVVHQSNGGHGAAVLNGYQRALELSPEWVFQVDSDGEMPAELFPRMWARRAEGRFVMGWRTGRSSNPVRLALSTVHRWLLRMMFGVTVRDPNIPYRLMSAECLAGLIGHLPPGLFAPNVFLALLAVRAGVAADGVAVPVSPRAGGTMSIRGWKTLRLGVRCAHELLRFRLREWRRFKGV